MRERERGDFLCERRGEADGSLARYLVDEHAEVGLHENMRRDVVEDSADQSRPHRFDQIPYKAHSAGLTAVMQKAETRIEAAREESAREPGGGDANSKI